MKLLKKIYNNKYKIQKNVTFMMNYQPYMYIKQEIFLKKIITKFKVNL